MGRVTIYIKSKLDSQRLKSLNGGQHLAVRAVSTKDVYICNDLCPLKRKCIMKSLDLDIKFNIKQDFSSVRNLFDIRVRVMSEFEHKIEYTLVFLL